MGERSTLDLNAVAYLRKVEGRSLTVLDLAEFARNERQRLRNETAKWIEEMVRYTSDDLHIPHGSTQKEVQLAAILKNLEMQVNELRGGR